MSGEEQTVDFTGFGDVDMSRQDLEFAEESADRMAQAMLVRTREVRSRLCEATDEGVGAG